MEVSSTEQNLLQLHADKQKRNIAGAGFTSDPRTPARNMKLGLLD